MSSHLTSWGTQFQRKSFFHQKEQTLFPWTAGIWNSLHYYSHWWVSYHCMRGSKGTAAAWLQQEAIPLLSRKADTWALPPLPFAKWINLSSILLASIHLSIIYHAFQYSVICKTSSFKLDEIGQQIRCQYPRTDWQMNSQHDHVSKNFFKRASHKQ